MTSIICQEYEIRINDPDSRSRAYIHSDPTRASVAEVVILHGAGTSSSGRHRSLRADLVDSGARVLSIDFPGQGEAAGSLLGQTLLSRLKHAQCLIEQYGDKHLTRTVVAFSMSGDTTVRLLAEGSLTIHRLVLVCPAIYPEASLEVPFGQAFTTCIQEADAWRTSRAFELARLFTGHVDIVIGSDDEVIPIAVIDELDAAFRIGAKRVRTRVLDGVDHGVGRVIEADGVLRHAILRMCIS